MVDESSQGSTSTRAPDPSMTIDAKENIKIVVRIRPLLAHEAGFAAVLAGNDNVVRVNGATANRQLQCRYDAVIGPEVSQEGMFSHVRECTSAVLEGINSTVFAYGQTGSGKTYTMFGPGLDADGGATPGYGKGVIPLAVADLFKGLVRKKKCFFVGCKGLSIDVRHFMHRHLKLLISNSFSVRRLSTCACRTSSNRCKPKLTAPPTVSLRDRLT